MKNGTMEPEPAPIQPRFYIVRPEPQKAFVPLIAVDEIPSLFRLQGVPANLDPKTINDWNLARVGDTTPFRGQYDVLINPEESKALQGSSSSSDSSNSPPTARHQHVDDASDTQASTRNVGTEQQPTWLSIATFKEQMHVSHFQRRGNHFSLTTLQTAMNKVVEEKVWQEENDHSKTKDAMTPGVFGKKQYCTHWIRTGNCDYVQEGCKYLHVIPDEETRLRIGIRDMPRWAKEDLLPPHPQAAPPVAARNNGRNAKSWRNADRPKLAQQYHPKTSVKAASLKSAASVSEASQQRKAPRSLAHQSYQNGTHAPTNIFANTPAASATPNQSMPTSVASGSVSKASVRLPTQSVNDSFQRQLQANSTPVQAQASQAEKVNNENVTSQRGYNPSHADKLELQSPTASVAMYQPLGQRDSTLHNTQGLSGTVLGSPLNQTHPASPSPFQTPSYRRFSGEQAHINGFSTSLGAQGPYSPTMQVPNVANSHRGPPPDAYVLSNVSNTHAPNTPVSQGFQHHSNGSRTNSPAVTTNTPIAAATGPHDFGIIGQGRPSQNGQSTPTQQPKPFTELPVHRRLFVNPGEDQYVVAKAEDRGKPKSNRSSRKRGSVKGRGKTHYDSDNLISFDTDHTTEG